MGIRQDTPTKMENFWQLLMQKNPFGALIQALAPATPEQIAVPYQRQANLSGMPAEIPADVQAKYGERLRGGGIPGTINPSYYQVTPQDRMNIVQALSNFGVGGNEALDFSKNYGLGLEKMPRVSGEEALAEGGGPIVGAGEQVGGLKMPLPTTQPNEGLMRSKALPGILKPTDEENLRASLGQYAAYGGSLGDVMKYVAPAESYTASETARNPEYRRATQAATEQQATWPERQKQLGLETQSKEVALRAAKLDLVMKGLGIDETMSKDIREMAYKGADAIRGLFMKSAGIGSVLIPTDPMALGTAVNKRTELMNDIKATMSERGYDERTQRAILAEVAGILNAAIPKAEDFPKELGRLQEGMQVDVDEGALFK